MAAAREELAALEEEQREIIRGLRAIGHRTRRRGRGSRGGKGNLLRGRGGRG
jgi:hypothetical protein